MAISVVFSGSALAVTDNANDRAIKARETAKARLEGAKLRACENRERVINNILDRLAKRGERRLGVYSKIYERILDFYDKHELPVPNYDGLVADTNAKKTAAESAVAKIKSGEVDFSCDGSDPKGVAAGFKAGLKAEIQALQAYHQSIKELIKSIKTAVADTANNPTSSEGEQ